MAVRRGLNELFLGNPTTNPALRKVHLAMGCLATNLCSTPNIQW
jgi:hypothetical protein